jgi:hypothetical protein
MMRWIAEASPRSRARAAGLLYLLSSLTAVFDQFLVLGRLVVPGDAARTSASILAHETLLQLGFAAYLLSVASYIVVVALFYELFRPVSRSISLIAAFFGLGSCVVQWCGSLFHLAPLLVLENGAYSSAFTAQQLHALALMFLQWNAQAFDISLGVGGFYILLIGALIVGSTFLPRILGVLMVLAGLGYLTLLSPPLASWLSPYNITPAGIAENALTVWLIVFGVNARRWQEASLRARLSC